MLAGPNGAGKTRYLALVPAVVTSARTARIALKRAMEDEERRRDSPKLSSVFWGDLDSRLETARRGAEAADEDVPDAIAKSMSQGHAGVGEHEFVPLTYIPPNPTALVKDTTARPLTVGDRPPGLLGPQETATAYFERVANVLWQSKHPEAGGNVSLAGELAAANSFADLVDRLVGGRIEPNLDDDHHARANFRKRPFIYAELSRGEQILVAWAIMFHTQRESLRDAIVLIDEPEQHLHPDACVRVIDTLRQSILGDKGQVWIATHSVPLIAHGGLACVWMVDRGQITYAGNKIDQLLEGLLGAPDGHERLRTFLSDAHSLAFHKFAAECLAGPDVAAAKHDDPQEQQFVADVLERAVRGETVRILDVGAGRGRLAAALAERKVAGAAHPALAHVSYLAFNGPTAAAPEIEECKAHLQNLQKAGVPASFVEDLAPLASDRVDLAVMCNVLHEIHIANWLSLFQSIFQILEQKGVLVLMEDQTMSTGELPNNNGFLVLDCGELAALFSTTTERIRCTVRDDRLTLIEIPRDFVGRATEATMANALRKLHARAIAEVKCLRERKDTSFRQGRRHAYYALLQTNALLALDSLGAPREC